MIGIIGALDIELQRLIDAMDAPERCEISGIPFARGCVPGGEIVVARAGIGKVNAAVCAQTMVLRYAPQLIINTGVSGALANGLHVGDVVVGTDVVQHDVDTTALGDAPGFVSTVNRLAFPLNATAAEGILAAARSLGLRAVRGRVASGDQFVASSARKAEIVRLFAAATCEMEAGAIAQVCFLSGIPCAVIRSISDGGNEEAAMSYEEFLPLAAKNSAELTLEFLKTRRKL